MGIEKTGRPVALELEGVSRSYRRGRHTIQALRDLDARIHPHTLTAVTGPSGSGKSTLLRVRPIDGVNRRSN